MSRIIVSILSEHSIPNFLFMKEMERRYDEMLFITTAQVDEKRRGEQLVKALGLDKDVVFIVVDANDYCSALSTLKQEWETREGDEYIVNLTGGTKIMSLVVHDFFATMKSRFYYVPIGKNTFYDIASGTSSELHYRVNLKEYFTFYGIRYKNTKESELTHTEQEDTDIYNEVREHRFCLPDKLRFAQESPSSELRRYYAGTWFEQFSYFCVKRALHLREEDIGLSVKIYREGDQALNDNELDVAFMYENALYIVECKVTMRGLAGAKDTIEEYLYKLAAIAKDFGLQVRPYIFTLHRVQSLSEATRDNLVKRCQILGVRNIIYGNDFMNMESALSKPLTM